MSDIEHPSKDQQEEHVTLVPMTLAFAATSVVTLIGMFVAIIWNYHGGL